MAHEGAMERPAVVPGRMVLHPAWLAFAALALAVPLAALMFHQATRGANLPVLAELPRFALVDQDGKPFHRDDMLGRVWVADFVFTSCADACPRLQSKMRRLQDRFIPPEQGGKVALLSISVDPERDTPAKLRQYAETFGARKGMWQYLTGEQKEVERTVVQGFHTAMAKIPAQGDDPHMEAFDIMHGERLVLVDAMGRIRGFYDADDQDAIVRDARALTPGGRG